MAKACWLVVFLAGWTFMAAGQAQYSVIIRNGMVYDGSGRAPVRVDLGIRADTIAALGDLRAASAEVEIDAAGKAVAPGFINMLSWADGTLLQDGRAVSDIKQGVTLEIFGEGQSPGPRIRKPGSSQWTTLGGYFEVLRKKGVSVNFGSLVGATTVRSYVLGDVNLAPGPAELIKMKGLVRQAMTEGALGVGSSLIYAPATFASTAELIELCKAAAPFKGIYMTHMRSESDHILSALNETFRIAREAGVAAEIYHLKINQERNWSKIDTVLFKIDSARASGLRITANVYPYIASATGLKERVPNWAQDGGIVQMRKRIRNPELRKKILYDMAHGIPTRNSDPKNVVLLGFKKDSLMKLYKDKRLDEVARLHGKDADETVLDLLVADQTSIPALYFLMSEDNLRKFIVQPYVSVGSDAGALALTPDFVDKGAHPRAYGSFARVLAKYVREEKLLTLEEAIRKMTALPASTLGLKDRGLIKVGFAADITVFDPATIQDHATFEQPHQYATGTFHVWVNGVQVLKDGEPTGKTPGRLVRR